MTALAVGSGQLAGGLAVLLAVGRPSCWQLAVGSGRSSRGQLAVGSLAVTSRWLCHWTRVPEHSDLGKKS